MAIAGAAQAGEGDTLRGMALMIGAACVLPCLDAVAKLLGATLSPAQVAFLRFSTQTVILAAVLLILGRTLLPRQVRVAVPRLALGGAFMAVATLCFFWSLQHLPLANAIVLLFVAPLFLSLYGALFLGERVGPHRIGAVLVGFAGAIVVIRPNLFLFGYAAVLPIVAAACFAGLMATVRSIRGSIDGVRTQLIGGAFASAFLGLALAAGLVLDVPQLALSVPAAETVPLIALLAVLGVAGHAMLTFAARFAEASLIAPFQYFEIVSATAVGYLVFSEFPDMATFGGGAIILGAGLYTMHRERRRARLAAKEPAITPVRAAAAASDRSVP